MKILAVGAHPDDMELCCAGTLAKYAAAGHEIGMAVMTDGATGSATIPASELVGIRKAEAEASAAVIGAKFYWLGLPDGKLEYDVASRMALNRVVREFSPELIITHNPEDYISDHRITSKHVVDVGLWAHVGPLIPDLPGVPESPSIAFMDALAGTNFIPERYIDITEFFALKEKMLLCHRSQQDWMSDYGSVNYKEMIQVCARYRGFQSGTTYAEGFRIWHGWQTSKCEPIMPS